MRQATLKQVQLLEKVEASCGVKYTGTKWVLEEVSAYLDANMKKKDNDNSNENQKKGGQKQPITDKQKQYIKVLENKTGVCFMGKTFEDAKAYIEKNRGN